MLFVENWKQLGIITLSESGRSQRDKCCMLPFICVPWTYRYIKSRMYRWHEHRSRITWGGDGGLGANRNMEKKEREAVERICLEHGMYFHEYM